MNVNELISAQRLASLSSEGASAIRSYQIVVASILKRLVIHDHFTYSMALVCAGMDVDNSSLETNIENLRMKMEEYKSTHGPPNYEIHPESFIERRRE